MVKKSATISLDVINDEDESDIPARAIRIFLSYSHKDKKLSGELKKRLEGNGFETFMAHEDIDPSKEWEEEIIRNLKECDIFIPIVSNNFKESKWTDQETGIAFAEDKLIIPIDIGLVPYGFIGKYQALKYDENISHTCEKIMDTIRKTPIYDKVKGFFIKRFVESEHFVEANERIGELKLFESFTDDQINEIIRGYVNNLEIRGGFASVPFVDSLFKKYFEVIDPELKEKYEACPETRARAREKSDKVVVSPKRASVGDPVRVYSDSHTAGEVVQIYFDYVQSEFILSESVARNDGVIEQVVTIPETEIGIHYFWVKDLATGLVERASIQII